MAETVFSSPLATKAMEPSAENVISAGSLPTLMVFLRAYVVAS
jgi:hypothetical protein